MWFPRSGREESVIIMGSRVSVRTAREGLAFREAGCHPSSWQEESLEEVRRFVSVGVDT